MKLYIRQKVLSLLNSYHIYNEHKELCYYVKSNFALLHHMNLYDVSDCKVGELKELFGLMPKFSLIENGQEVVRLKKHFTWFKDYLDIEQLNWQVHGDFFSWNYQIYENGTLIATISEKLLVWSDTYEIDIHKNEDVVKVLLVVLALDAIQCSSHS